MAISPTLKISERQSERFVYVILIGDENVMDAQDEE